MTIAVNLGGPAISKEITDDALITSDSPSPELHKKISRYIDKFQQSIKSSNSLDWGAYDIANQAFDAMQSTIARQKLAAYPPDITIEIARNACGTLEFDLAPEIIALGYLRAQECLTCALEEN